MQASVCLLRAVMSRVGPTNGATLPMGAIGSIGPRLLLADPARSPMGSPIGGASPPILLGRLHRGSQGLVGRGAGRGVANSFVAGRGGYTVHVQPIVGQRGGPPLQPSPIGGRSPQATRSPAAFDLRPSGGQGAATQLDAASPQANRSPVTNPSVATPLLPLPGPSRRCGARSPSDASPQTTRSPAMFVLQTGIPQPQRVQLDVRTPNAGSTPRTNRSSHVSPFHGDARSPYLVGSPLTTGSKDGQSGCCFFAPFQLPETTETTEKAALAASSA